MSTCGKSSSDLVGVGVAVCDTRSCCEDDGGRGYVVPTADTCDAAIQMLTDLGLHPESVQGTVYFPMPDSIRLDDAEQVQRRILRRTGITATWRVNDNGVFERSSSDRVPPR